MKNLLIVIFIGLAGWFAYQKWYVEAPPPWQPLRMPDPVAWKQVATFSNGFTMVVVCLVDGDCWRTEARQYPTGQTVVSICDGTNFVTSSPNVRRDRADPRTIMETSFSNWRDSTPVRSAEYNGQACWVYTDTPDKMELNGETWISKKTRFPLYTTEQLKNGGHGSAQFHVLKSDFSILAPACFNTRSTATMLDPFLNKNMN